MAFSFARTAGEVAILTALAPCASASTASAGAEPASIRVSTKTPGTRWHASSVKARNQAVPCTSQTQGGLSRMAGTPSALARSKTPTASGRLCTTTEILGLVTIRYLQFLTSGVTFPQSVPLRRAPLKPSLRLIALVLALIGAATGAWYFLKAPIVDAALVSRGLAVEAIYATGTVEPVRWAKVSPTVTARLVELFAHEGDVVKEGDKLARLDEGEARARVAELAAREIFLKQDLDRVERLARSEFASRQSSERAKSELGQVAQARAAAQKRLNEYVLLSPVSGTVFRRDGEPGEVMQPGQIMYWVGELKPLRVTAEIDEEDIVRLGPNQKALLKADAFPGEALVSSVAEITPKGDPVNKTYRVRLALPDDTRLLVGMTVEVNVIVRETPDALLVPAQALENGHIWVVRDGRAERRSVKAGVKGARQSEILDGVAEGETV
ncbi:MAG: efflux RND transporter periplasmic adaptor subunit, partial [Rhodospirillales bacterium]